jgi:hypothetical protein
VVVDADYHFLKAEDGNGGRGRLKATFRPGDRGTVGADLQVLKVPDNGYWQARVFCTREWGRASGTLDVWYYKYDKQVNGVVQGNSIVDGVDHSVGGTATGGWQIAPAWRVLLAATAGSDPFFKSRLDVMAKLAWTQNYVREVR